MKQKKKRPIPPPPPAVMDDDQMEKRKKAKEEDEPPDMPDRSNMYELDDPVYQARHALAQDLQKESALEGYVLLKNTGILPLSGKVKLNVFGRHAKLFFTPALCERYGVSLNKELFDFYRKYKTTDAGYTGMGYEEETGTYVPQNRTAAGMFGNLGYLDHEPFLGHTVYNRDGSVRVSPIPEAILERAKAFSDTAVVVLYRHGGEGADHEKGDERLSEGEVCAVHNTWRATSASRL